ncbi:MAG: DUF47 domain-containing protein [Deltaproteobacteria bacterium]|nr:DUF47 domain-containing protein [Deltaproteobacteria bacterium]
MFKRLLPRETSFFDYFEQHAALTLEGAKEMLSLVSTGANIPAKAKRIKEIEHECDVLTHRCIAALHKTFITPMERHDIHKLMSKMDDIMDYVEAAGDRFAVYEVPEMRAEARDLADVIVRSAEVIQQGLAALRSGKDGDGVLKCCVEIHRLENEGDAVLRSALGRLFKEEKDAISVIKWKEIFEQLENASDCCEDVANVLEGVVLESA